MRKLFLLLVTFVMVVPLPVGCGGGGGYRDREPGVDPGTNPAVEEPASVTGEKPANPQ